MRTPEIPDKCLMVRLFHACLTVLAALLMVLSLQGLWAADAPTDLLAGMEVELSGEVPLGNILEFYDFKKLNAEETRRLRDALKGPVLDDYLEPRTLSRLPQAIQDRLTQGIRLGVDVQVQHRAVLAADGKSAASSAPLVLGSSEGRNSAPTPSRVESRNPAPLILDQAPRGMARSTEGILIPSSAKTAPPKAIELSDSQRADLNWQEVKRRWVAMPETEKRALVDPALLPKQVRAVLVKAHIVRATHLTLRKDLPEAVSSLLSRLTFHNELSAIEFKHTEPVESAEALSRDIERFADLAGIRKFMENPSSPEPDVHSFSLHFHMSRRTRNFSKMADQLNQLRLLDLAEQGRGEAALGRFGYSEVGYKGLMRLVSSTRIETRAQVLGPRAEVEGLARLMTMPEAEAVPLLEKRIKDKVAALEEVLRNRGSANTPKERSALLALLKVRPESPMLNFKQVEDLALSSLDFNSRGIELLIEERLIPRLGLPTEVLADFSKCSNLACIHFKLSATNRRLALLHGEEAESLRSTVNHSLLQDLPRWKSFPDYNATRLFQRFWSQSTASLPISAESADKIGELIIRDATPKEGSLAESVVQDLKFRTHTAESLERELASCETIACQTTKLKGWVSARTSSPRHAAGFETALESASIRSISRWPSLPDYRPENLLAFFSAESPLVPSARNTLFETILHTPPEGARPAWWQTLKTEVAKSEVSWRRAEGELTRRFLESKPGFAEIQIFFKGTGGVASKELLVSRALDIIESPGQLQEIAGWEGMNGPLHDRLRSAAKRLLSPPIAQSRVPGLLNMVSSMPFLESADLQPLWAEILSSPENVDLRYFVEGRLSAFAPLARKEELSEVHRKWAASAGNKGADEKMAQFLRALGRSELLPEVVTGFNPVVLEARKVVLKQTPTDGYRVPLVRGAGGTGDVLGVYLQKNPGGPLQNALLEALLSDLSAEKPSRDSLSRIPLRSLWRLSQDSSAETAALAIRAFDRVVEADPSLAISNLDGPVTFSQILAIRKQISPAPTYIGTAEKMAAERLSVSRMSSSALGGESALDPAEGKKLFALLGSQDDAEYKAGVRLLASYGLRGSNLVELKSEKAVLEFRALMMLLHQGKYDDLLQNIPMKEFDSRYALGSRLRFFREFLDPAESERFSAAIKKSLLKALAPGSSTSMDRASAALWTVQSSRLNDPEIVDGIIRLLNTPVKGISGNYLGDLAVDALQSLDIQDEARLKRIVRPPVGLFESEKIKTRRIQFALTHRLKHPGLAEEIRTYLRDPSGDVRAEAARAFGKAWDSAPPPTLSTRVVDTASQCSRWFGTLIGRH